MYKVVSDTDKVARCLDEFFRTFSPYNVWRIFGLDNAEQEFDNKFATLSFPVGPDHLAVLKPLIAYYAFTKHSVFMSNADINFQNALAIVQKFHRPIFPNRLEITLANDMIQIRRGVENLERPYLDVESLIKTIVTRVIREERIIVHLLESQGPLVQSAIEMLGDRDIIHMKGNYFAIVDNEIKGVSFLTEKLKGSLTVRAVEIEYEDGRKVVIPDGGKTYPYDPSYTWFPGEKGGKEFMLVRQGDLPEGVSSSCRFRSIPIHKLPCNVNLYLWVYEVNGTRLGEFDTVNKKICLTLKGDRLEGDRLVLLDDRMTVAGPFVTTSRKSKKLYVIDITDLGQSEDMRTELVEPPSGQKHLEVSFLRSGQTTIVRAFNYYLPSND